MTTQSPTISFDELLSALKADCIGAFPEVDGRVYTNQDELPDELILPHIVVYLPNDGVMSDDWVSGTTREVKYRGYFGYFCIIPENEPSKHTWKRAIQDKFMAFFCADGYYQEKFFFPKVGQAYVDTVKSEGDNETYDGIGLVFECGEEINGKNIVLP